MLASACFCDNPRFAHADREQYLPDAIVDLMSAGVIELVAFEPDLRAFSRRRVLAQFLGQALREIERGGAAHIMLQQVVKLGLKRRVTLRCAILALQIENKRHQRFGDITAAKLTKVPAFIWLVFERIGLVGHLWPFNLRLYVTHRVAKGSD